MRVIDLQAQGWSYSAIAAELNGEGVLTPDGRPVWRKSSVDRLLHTRHARELWEE